MNDVYFKIYGKAESIDDIINDIHSMTGGMEVLVDSTLRMYYKHMPTLFDGSRTVSVRFPDKGALYIPYGDEDNSHHKICYVRNPDHFKDPGNEPEYVPFGTADIDRFAYAHIGHIPESVLKKACYDSTDELIKELSEIVETDIPIRISDPVTVDYISNFRPNEHMKEIMDKYGLDYKRQ
ncbi:MAG: hypothetical protein ACLFPQ_04000 [Candidatus Woesearchaeota archaeon]